MKKRYNKKEMMMMMLIKMEKKKKHLDGGHACARVVVIKDIYTKQMAVY